MKTVGENKHAGRDVKKEVIGCEIEGEDAEGYIFPRQRVRSEGEALGGVVGGWHMCWKR